ncbi:MAG TPA: hypothetical protein VF134_03145, partial [Candidatus Dormibacteraeota bacterium]
AILDIWHSDANALLREKLRRLSARRLIPLLTAVIVQGVAEGSISAADPEETARVIGHLMLAYQDVASEYFIARHAGRMTYEEVTRGFAAYLAAYERILGIEPGSIRLTDEATMRFWFD